MSLLAPSPADVRRRRGLRRMRVLALSLLLLAAVVYVATLHDRSGAWGYVNTAAEAAMVGALADWFAVTALFKHPLGLPIPHTAIIPKRKNEIGRNLQDFVTENFLTEEIARERLAAARVGARIGRWLGERPHRDRVMTEAVRIGPGRARPAQRRRGARPRRRLPAAPARRRTGEPHRRRPCSRGSSPTRPTAASSTSGSSSCASWLSENPGTYAAVLGERAPWWTPPWVDDRVIGWTYQQVLDLARRHPWRPAAPGPAGVRRPAAPARPTTCSTTPR